MRATERKKPRKLELKQKQNYLLTRIKMNQGLTFRSTKITYYGPHPCSQCGTKICKMAQGFGGNAFTYPDGPIYPNTEWHVHVCNPRDIIHRKALYCKDRVLEKNIQPLKLYARLSKGGLLPQNRTIA